ncbi:MAG: MBL fold metallo-hydrolase [Candidatus Uhrbacteria bacterium]
MPRSPIQTRVQPLKLIKRRKKILGLGIITMVMILSLVWQASYTGWFFSERELKVWVFDVGQGDAIFIETPDGKQILVDAGAGGTILTKLGEVMLPWDRTIDAVVVTHPHADHEGGLPEVLRRYNVGTIYETGVLGYNDLQETVEELVSEKGTETVMLTNSTLPLQPAPRSPSEVGSGEASPVARLWPRGRGEGAPTDEKLKLEFLAPDTNLQNKKIDNLNNSSIVLLLTYGETSILLTGDAAFEEEPEILNDITEPIDILKIAHHGSVTSTSREFLETVAPRYAIISVGAENDYGHPHPVTLERLKTQNIESFRTDLDGDILITSTGGEPTVESRPLPF